MKISSYLLSIIGLIILLFAAPGIAAESRSHTSDLGSHDILRNDIKAEVQFGRNLVARLLARHPLVEDPTTQYYVNLVGNSVATSTGRPELRFYFGVIEGKKVDAFAVPGGYIFITSAALDLLGNESELAGVLSHEIGHLISKHMVNELQIGVKKKSTGLSPITGDIVTGLQDSSDQTLDKAMDILFHRGYRMTDELEADQIGILLSDSAGYDPSGLKNFIMRVKHFGTAPSDHSGTHPAYKVRADAIDNTLKNKNIKPISYSKGTDNLDKKLID